jgi:hypothetical protein
MRPSRVSAMVDACAAANGASSKRNCALNPVSSAWSAGLHDSPAEEDQIADATNVTDATKNVPAIGDRNLTA